MEVMQELTARTSAGAGTPAGIPVKLPTAALCRPANFSCFELVDRSYELVAAGLKSMIARGRPESS